MTQFVTSKNGPLYRVSHVNISGYMWCFEVSRAGYLYTWQNGEDGSDWIGLRVGFGWIELICISHMNFFFLRKQHVFAI